MNLFSSQLEINRMIKKPTKVNWNTCRPPRYISNRFQTGFDPIVPQSLKGCSSRSMTEQKRPQSAPETYIQSAKRGVAFFLFLPLLYIIVDSEVNSWYQWSDKISNYTSDVTTNFPLWHFFDKWKMGIFRAVQQSIYQNSVGSHDFSHWCSWCETLLEAIPAKLR